MITAGILAAVACLGPYVVDGDTLQCGAERVRLYGVNAPELAHFGRPAEPGAVEARHALARLAARRVVCIEAGNGRDRYGRLVAKCSALDLREPDIGRALVRAGWARDWPRYSGGRYAGDELDARVRRLGIWRAPGRAP